MANTQNKRIQPNVLQVDEEALTALKALGDYKPANPVYSDAILVVKVQVTAQYGPSSDQVASLGLKKKSERKAPVRKSKAAA